MSIARKILMGSSGGKKSTYVDDVFSKYVYKGTGSPQTITNGIDLAGEGGMTWIKSRDWTRSHNIYDTVRGTNKVIYTESTSAEVTKGPANQDSGIYQFNNNGFNIGAINGVGASGYNYSSWSFRKQEGFFDVVTYTGNGSNRTISHNLGSVPGCIMVKRTDAQSNWMVYHRDAGGSNPGGWSYLFLDTTASVANATSVWNDTDPTSSVFSVGTDAYVNANGGSYVAYIFAGGESNAATARGVRFDGSNDYLSLDASSDFDMGTGDFTIECWLKRDDTSNNSAWTLGSYDNGMELYCYSDDSLRVYGNNGGGSSWLIQSPASVISPGVWHHVAVVRDSGTLKLFQNGTLLGSTAHSSAMPNNGETTDFFIGVEVSSSNTIPNTNPYFDGELSNFRVVKGTAVYTSSFRPPYEPLTNITNTKLLCCNNSSVTGSTVTPGTITAHSSPTATTNSPFDDPEGFQFGKEGDQNIIKCGSYTTDPNEDAHVYLGWEPQWVIIKRIDGGSHGWNMVDSLRGFPNAQDIGTNQYGGCQVIEANSSAAEYSTTRYGLTPTGFYADQFGANRSYVYIAIRMPDGLVEKPALAGTDRFAMDAAGGNNTQPTFDLGFAVGGMMRKQPAASTTQFMMSYRLASTFFFDMNSAGSEQSNSNVKYDYSNGVGAWTGDLTSYQAWGWKRGAGFDVVTYAGNSVAGRQVPHSLGRVPEMMWVKSRTGNTAWRVYHSGVVGGYDGTNTWNTNSNAAKYQLYLNNPYWAVNNTSSFNETEPTSTTFTLGTTSGANSSGNKYVNWLFSSVAGLSKVGNYTGSSYALTITTGFSPRFVIIKNIKNQGNNWTTGWFTFDTTRGWAVGDSKRLRLNDNAAQTAEDWTNPTSTGFTINANSGNHLNNNGDEYIYYAHA